MNTSLKYCSNCDNVFKMSATSEDVSIKCPFCKEARKASDWPFMVNPNPTIPYREPKDYLVTRLVALETENAALKDMYAKLSSLNSNMDLKLEEVEDENKRIKEIMATLCSIILDFDGQEQVVLGDRMKKYITQLMEKTK